MNLFKMGLGGKEFDLVAGHLVDALNALNVPSNITADIVEVVSPLRSVFVEGGAKFGPKPAPTVVQTNEAAPTLEVCQACVSFSLSLSY